MDTGYCRVKRSEPLISSPKTKGEKYGPEDFDVTLQGIEKFSLSSLKCLFKILQDVAKPSETEVEAE